MPLFNFPAIKDFINFNTVYNENCIKMLVILNITILATLLFIFAVQHHLIY